MRRLKSSTDGFIRKYDYVTKTTKMTPRNGPFRKVMGVGLVRLGKIYQYICQVKKTHIFSHCCKNNATKVKKKKRFPRQVCKTKFWNPQITSPPPLACQASPDKIFTEISCKILLKNPGFVVVRPIVVSRRSIVRKTLLLLLLFLHLQKYQQWCLPCRICHITGSI